MNGAYESFRVAGQNKADIDSYIALVKPKVHKLIKEQVKALKSAKVQMHMWIMWKKQEEVALQLDDEGMEDWTEEEKQAYQESDHIYYTSLDKVFNSLMTEVNQGTNIEELLHGMFTYIKTQVEVEHLELPNSGFILDHFLQISEIGRIC